LAGQATGLYLVMESAEGKPLRRFFPAGRSLLPKPEKERWLDSGPGTYFAYLTATGVRGTATISD